MTIRSASPYLILNGKADQAIEFYQQALGATAESVMRFGEMHASCAEAQRNLVMHAVLRVGGAQIMLSDGPGEAPLSTGGAVSVALDFDDEAQTRRVFDALAVGGRVFEPLFDAPWGALFGVVTDKYAVAWMFNCAKAG